MFRCIVRGRDNQMSLKDFCSQLLAEEAVLDTIHFVTHFVSAMMAKEMNFQGKAFVLTNGPASGSQPTLDITSGFIGLMHFYSSRGSHFLPRGQGCSSHFL